MKSLVLYAIIFNSDKVIKVNFWLFWAVSGYFGMIDSILDRKFIPSFTFGRKSDIPTFGLANFA